MGGIGIGVRGENDLRAFLSFKEVKFAAICDVRNERREAMKGVVDTKYQNRDCAIYSDYYELLGREDIDAVLIATGDRWHARALDYRGAARQGRLLREAPLDVDCGGQGGPPRIPPLRPHLPGRLPAAQRRQLPTGRGTVADRQARKTAGRLRQRGALAKLAASALRGWLPAEPEPPKSVFDWDRWLGPAPWRPFNSVYAPNWGWVNVADFHSGGILEWGSHTVDVCHWASQTETTQPVEYVPEGNNDGPYAVHCRFANGVKLEMVDEGRNGRLGLGSNTVRFVGDEGWVETGDGGKVVTSENLRSVLRPTT